MLIYMGLFRVPFIRYSGCKISPFVGRHVIKGSRHYKLTDEYRLKEGFFDISSPVMELPLSYNHPPTGANLILTTFYILIIAPARERNG